MPWPARLTVHAFVMKSTWQRMPEIVAENLTKKHRRPLRTELQHHDALPRKMKAAANSWRLYVNISAWYIDTDWKR